MRRLFLVVLILAGCANPNFDAGRKNFSTGNYTAAFYNFKTCYEQTSDPVCACDAGTAARSMDDLNAARSWWTLAARYGQPMAISGLTANGWPVPYADIAQQQAQQQQVQLLRSVGQGLQSAGNVMQSAGKVQPPRQINCTSDSYGGPTVYTHCQ